jgi:hypothetical protein
MGRVQRLAALIVAGGRLRIRQSLWDRLSGSLEGSSGLFLRSWMAFNIFCRHDRRQSPVRIDSRYRGAK